MSYPFQFYTSSNLIELTGKKAGTLHEFFEILKSIDESSIFCHTHQALREKHFARGIYTNDFAYWISEKLEEPRLAEAVANIDILDYTDLNSLRAAYLSTISGYLSRNAEFKKVRSGDEFHFLKNIGVIMPIGIEVKNLTEFRSALKRVGISSIYFHFFEARLRLNRKTNDFSNWIETSLKNEVLAREIALLDPYLYTLEGLRSKIVGLIEKERKIYSLQKYFSRTQNLFRKIDYLFGFLKRYPITQALNLIRRIFKWER